MIARASAIRRALACVLLGTLVACSRAAGPAGGPGGHNAWTHPGILRMVDLEEPDNLDPIVGNSQIDSDLAELWGGKLFDWNDRNELVPELATVVPTLANGGISKDGLTYVYHLRPGVLWQDGQKFTADDVVFTWHAVTNKKNNVGSTVGYDLIRAIDVRDPFTIAVHIRHPFAPFVSAFFAPSGTPYPVLPKHLLAQYDNINRVAFNSAPVGTGPFILQHWQRGSKLVFKANPHYWRGPPKLKEFWYTPIPDENTVVTQLRSHDADIDYNLSSSAFASAQDIPGYASHLTPFTQYGQLALNTKSPLLADVAVRRALWYGLDVKRLIDTITHGVNTVGYTDQPSFLWAYNPNTAHYDYDPAKARALLDAEGWKVGPDGIRSKGGQRLSLTLAGITGSATGNAVNVQTQNQWREIGVEGIVKLYTTAKFFSSYGEGGILQTGKFDVGFYSWINGVDPDDSTLFMCDQIPPNGQNVYHYCNPELDAQERVALSSSDQAVRKKAYDRIQFLLARDVPLIITWYNRRVSVVNTDLRNWKPAHAVSSFWNSYEWSI